MGITEQGMKALYPASIIHIPIQPRLLSNYAQHEVLSASEWEAYLVRHGASLARLLARLPCLKDLMCNLMQYAVVYQAVFFQPCGQLISIDSRFSRSSKKLFPCQANAFQGPNVLHLAIIKGHLPSWGELKVQRSLELAIINDAVRAGHLTHIKRLMIYGCKDEPLRLLSLLEAFTDREEKLEALYLHINTSLTQGAMHNLLCSPICSSLRKLQVDCGWYDEDEDEDGDGDGDRPSGALSSLRKYLKGAGMGGRATLRELIISSDAATEDVSCLADALLLGGERSLAPNLETVAFSRMILPFSSWEVICLPEVH